MRAHGTPPAKKGHCIAASGFAADTLATGRVMTSDRGRCSHWRQRWQRWREAHAAVDVPLRALQNYVRHQSANHAGSVAYSMLLSMFPLLLFLAAVAAYVGEPGTAARLVQQTMEYAPPLVAEVLRPVVDGLLAEPNRTLLTIGVLLTLWTASSGLQAVRTALNRAYGVQHGLPFWRARLKVMSFTLLATATVLLVFGSVVLLPYAWQLVQRIGATEHEMSLLMDALRYALAYLALTALYAAMYAYLPDRHQRVRGVVPGALLGALLWLLAAAVLSYTLRSAGKLALVYGSFTGLVATMVFLYVSAATLIFGAEVNAVVSERDRCRGADESRRA
jgi:membrane protein